MKYIAKRLKIMILVLLITFGLTACNRSVFHNPLPTPNKTSQGVIVGAVSGAAIASLFATGPGVIPAGAIIGGIAGGAIGNYFQRQQTLLQVLEEQGVRVIRVGDNMRVILPVDLFFYPDSQVINTRYFKVLNLVALYIRCFNKITVRVAGYTDDRCSQKRNLSLSYVRALNIANYLWAHHIDARLIFPVGYGDQYPIATNHTQRGRALNRRMVISFRVLHDYD